MNFVQKHRPNVISRKANPLLLTRTELIQYTKSMETLMSMWVRQPLAGPNMAAEDNLFGRIVCISEVLRAQAHKLAQNEDEELVNKTTIVDGPTSKDIHRPTLYDHHNAVATELRSQRDCSVNAMRTLEEKLQKYNDEPIEWAGSAYDDYKAREPNPAKRWQKSRENEAALTVELCRNLHALESALGIKPPGRSSGR
jgi:hypothetical protein